MSKNMTTSNNMNGMAVPDYLASLFEDVKPNISVGEQLPTISIKGKTFTAVMDGHKEQMMTRDQESGEQVPKSTLKVIILNHIYEDRGEKRVPVRSRVFYEGGYDPENPGAPDCYSILGILLFLASV